MLVDSCLEPQQLANAVLGRPRTLELLVRLLNDGELVHKRLLVAALFDDVELELNELVAHGLAHLTNDGELGPIGRLQFGAQLDKFGDLFGRAALAHLVEWQREAAPAEHEEEHVRLLVLVDGVVEGLLAREELVEYDAVRVDVRLARVHLLARTRARHLGRHPEQRADRVRVVSGLWRWRWRWQRWWRQWRR